MERKVRIESEVREEEVKICSHSISFPVRSCLWVAECLVDLGTGIKQVRRKVSRGRSVVSTGNGQSSTCVLLHSSR